jgi:hypothetical protein
MREVGVSVAFISPRRMGPSFYDDQHDDHDPGGRSGGDHDHRAITHQPISPIAPHKIAERARPTSTPLAASSLSSRGLLSAGRRKFLAIGVG